jgi:hypothetical protein
LEIYKKLINNGILTLNNFTEEGVTKFIFLYYEEIINNNEKVEFFINSLPSLKRIKEYICDINNKIEKNKEALIIKIVFDIFENYLIRSESPTYIVKLYYNL